METEAFGRAWPCVEAQKENVLGEVSENERPPNLRTTIQAFRALATFSWQEFRPKALLAWP